MALTRKNFQALADIVDGSRKTPLTPRQLALKLADVCAADNPRFDRAKFLRASGETYVEEPEPDEFWVDVLALTRDEGTVVVFTGQDGEGRRVDFSADHRPAQVLTDALAAGETPSVVLQPWQVIYHAS